MCALFGGKKITIFYRNFVLNRSIGKTLKTRQSDTAPMRVTRKVCKTLDKMAQLDKSALVHNLPQRSKAEFKERI